MPEFPISRVFETKFPTALMPSSAVGQINLSANGESFSFLMPRADFARLGRRIAALLAETPAPARKRGENPPSNEK
jgi:hypothetical protein